MAPLRTSHSSMSNTREQSQLHAQHHTSNTLLLRPPLTRPGLPRLNPQLDPSLQHPDLHLARLQPHPRGPPRKATRARHLAQLTHIRNLDVPDQHHPVLRRVPHQRASVLPARHLDVCGCVCALWKRVVYLWDDAVGEAACGAGDCQHGEFGLDGHSVGILCEVGVRWEVRGG